MSTLLHHLSHFMNCHGEFTALLASIESWPAVVSSFAATLKRWRTS